MTIGRITSLALAALLLSTAAPTPAAAQTRLVMAGSSAGGTAYLYFAALSPMLNKYIPGMEASARSGGSSENVVLLERGTVQVAGAAPGDAQGVFGKEAMAKSRIRTLFAMFNIPYHILVPRASSIQSFADLKGKRLSIGIKAGGDSAAFLRIVDALGLKEGDYRLDYLGKGEGVNAYKDSVVDAMGFLCPLPCPLVTELATHPRGARLLPLKSDEIAKVSAKFDWYTDYTIEKNWYAHALKDEAKDVPSFTEWFYVAARDDFPEEIAYQIAKVIGDHHDELVASFRAANSSTSANTAKYPGFKLHAGTERYLREKGLLK
ncbi:MAG: TAXI family TRAP transporter solute-binding subunit [Alphaproteobacteria bacterium]|nr:TAXI family TRAP transporter solute-binding subunit [Alphaproteobacteria bacterium]